jgi:phenylacetate-CoA ligase
MYSTLYRTMRLAWPGGLETRRHLRELNSMQWLTRQELEAWQFEKLQGLVRYAYEHVPYYRERYRREDIHPEDIRSPEDFQALPFLTREDVNENLAALTALEFAGDLHPVSTGGRRANRCSSLWTGLSSGGAPPWNGGRGVGMVCAKETRWPGCGVPHRKWRAGTAGRVSKLAS